MRKSDFDRLRVGSWRAARAHETALTSPCGDPFMEIGPRAKLHHTLERLMPLRAALSLGGHPGSPGGSQLQKGKARERVPGSKIIPRRRPTLPRGLPRSTIGAEGLNCRVRNGNGCGPFAKVTGKTSYSFPQSHQEKSDRNERTVVRSRDSRLKNLMVKPHDRLVLVSFRPRSASTPSLSTWSSPTGLQGVTPGKSHLEEGFPLICFQRLSFRTSLPGRAAGATTGAQEVRPSRSSRTKDGSSQISCAHTR